MSFSKEAHTVRGNGSSPKTATGMTISRRRVNTWLDALPQSKAIAHRALRRPALHAVAVLAATVAAVATGLTLRPPINRLEAA